MTLRKFTPINEAVEANRIELGRRLKARRLALGLTLRAVEARSGVSNPFVFQVESGVTGVSVDFLLALADALETSACELLRGLHS